MQAGRLRYANLAGSVWERDSLLRCDLREASLSGARLRAVELEGTDLSGCELFRAELAGLDLSRCSIDGIVLSQSCRELKGVRIGAHQAPVVARILGILVE